MWMTWKIIVYRCLPVRYKILIISILLNKNYNNIAIKIETQIFGLNIFHSYCNKKYIGFTIMYLS